jgi:hypothetical protein
MIIFNTFFQLVIEIVDSESLKSLNLQQYQFTKYKMFHL